MHLRKTNYVVLLLLLVFFTACDKKQFFSEYKELEGTWKKSDTLRFTFEQKDTINPYHLFLNVRNNNNYPLGYFHLSEIEGIIPALETAHAFAVLPEMNLKPTDVVIVCLSGRGDKDLATYMQAMDMKK